MIPTKEEWNTWCLKQTVKGYMLDDEDLEFMDKIYSFFSSSNDRVVEEIEKLKKGKVSQHDTDDYWYNMGTNETIRKVLSLIQPKEDENK